MADSLAPSQQLNSGGQLVAPNQKAVLAMQTDGNLVVYEKHDKGFTKVDVPAWSTQTNGKGGHRAVMQGDGNFVVYDRSDKPLWHAGTHGNPGARLVLQDDGNLVVYSPSDKALWNTQTIRYHHILPFPPAERGFHFANSFVNTVWIPGGHKLEFYGRCGGMSAAALDYYHARIPVPGYTPNLFPTQVPPDGHWLADYIGRRQGDSLLKASAHKFVTYSVTPDMSGWVRDAEFPEVVKRIDRGELTVLGMIAPSGIDVTQHHQVVAYGYEYHRTAKQITVFAYDCNAPDQEVLLTTEPGNPSVDAWGRGGYTETWKGFFAHDYTPSSPPAFTRNPAPASAVVTYGATVKLSHVLSGLTLHSHALNYGHPGSSGQQQVTCFAGADDNDLWRVKGPHGTPPGHAAGRPVNGGDTIRLEHVLTKRNLHSHGGFPSPVTGQQEVTCFGANGGGDENDDWRVDVDGGGQWGAQARVHLVHRRTNVTLHSHLGHQHPQWTTAQQEVTGFGPPRDDNDWWWLLEVR